MPLRAAGCGYACVGVGINLLPAGQRLAPNAWMGIHYRTKWLELGGNGIWTAAPTAEKPAPARKANPTVPMPASAARALRAGCCCAAALIWCS